MAHADDINEMLVSTIFCVESQVAMREGVLSAPMASYRRLFRLICTLPHPLHALPLVALDPSCMHWLSSSPID